jgi:tetratricopeptide (TPR) repeat protein
LMKAKLGPDHPSTLIVMHTLALTYRDVDRMDRALPLFEEVSRLRKAKLGPEHPQTWDSVYMLALTYRDAGRLDRAVPLLEEIAGRRKAKLGADHVETILSANQLVRAYLDARRWTEAEGMARQCVDVCTRTRPDDWLRYHSMSHLGAAMVGREKYAEAEPLLVGGYEGMKAREARIPARSRRFLASAASRIAPFYEAWGKADKAAEWRTKLGQPGPVRPKS